MPASAVLIYRSVFMTLVLDMLDVHLVLQGAAREYLVAFQAEHLEPSRAK